MTPESRALALEEIQLLEALETRHKRRLFHHLFPDVDTWDKILDRTFHARSKYAKQLEFFKAGAEFRERLLLAANRTGKSQAGAFETSAHLTGLYPDWWEGRRFDRPVSAWAAGKTNETTRDIVQDILFGAIGKKGAGKNFTGTGAVPGDLIGEISWKQGVSDLADTVKVKHVSGGWSVLGLKSYQQGRGSFEGTAQHVIWVDEEPPMDVYGECLIRTATTDGIVMLTFTPLAGMSDVVKSFLEDETANG